MGKNNRYRHIPGVWAKLSDMYIDNFGVLDFYYRAAYRPKKQIIMILIGDCREKMKQLIADGVDAWGK